MSFLTFPDNPGDLFPLQENQGEKNQTNNSSKTQERVKIKRRSVDKVHRCLYKYCMQCCLHGILHNSLHSHIVRLAVLAPAAFFSCRLTFSLVQNAVAHLIQTTYSREESLMFVQMTLHLECYHLPALVSGRWLFNIIDPTANWCCSLIN